jgi:hypothetical protein
VSVVSRGAEQKVKMLCSDEEQFILMDPMKQMLT